MSKQLVFKVIGPTLVLGLLMGGLGGYKIAKSTTKEEISNSKIVQPVKVEKNLYDGSNLTLNEMYNSLEDAKGSDFDHRLLMYEIALKQNESGMLRIAKEKSTQESMKKYSDIQMSQNDTVVKMLYSWQSQWGFSHH